MSNSLDCEALNLFLEKFGSKKGDFRGDLGGGLRGLDLVWESAILPTHIWENLPKNGFYFGGAPLNDHVKNYDDDHHHHQTEKPSKVLSVASLSWTASLQLSANHGINMVELIQ